MSRSEQISVTITKDEPWLKRRLMILAERDGRTNSQYIVRVLSKHIEEMEPEKYASRTRSPEEIPD